MNRAGYTPPATPSLADRYIHEISRDLRNAGRQHGRIGSDLLKNPVLKSISREMGYTPPGPKGMKPRLEQLSTRAHASRIDINELNKEEKRRKELAAQESDLTDELERVGIHYANVAHVAELLQQREAVRFLLAKPDPFAGESADSPSVAELKAKEIAQLKEWIRRLVQAKSELIAEINAPAFEGPSHFGSNPHKENLAALVGAISIAQENLSLPEIQSSSRLSSYSKGSPKRYRR